MRLEISAVRKSFWGFTWHNFLAATGCFQHKILSLNMSVNTRWLLTPQRLWGNLNISQVENPELKLLQEFGLKFEKQRLEALESTHQVKRLEVPKRNVTDYQVAWEATKQAMADEYEAIYQGTLFTGDFIGFVDFLVARKTSTGEFERDQENRVIYEPVDTKSARSAKKTCRHPSGCLC